MSRFRLGMTLESLNQPLRTAVVTIAQAGITALVFDAIGPLGPASLGETARREVRHLLQSHLITPTALRCPLRHGLEELDGLEQRLDRLRQAMQLSFDLGARLILLGIGPVPEKQDDLRRQRMKIALHELAHYGDRVGCRIALDAGSEPIETLLGFIREIDTASLGVSIDPAAFLLEKLPVESTVLAAKGLIAHSFARDMIPRRLDRPAREVRLGEGDVDLITWLACLEAAGYDGSLTIRQPISAQPVEDARQAVALLRRLGA